MPPHPMQPHGGAGEGRLGLGGHQGKTTGWKPVSEAFGDETGAGGGPLQVGQIAPVGKEADRALVGHVERGGGEDRAIRRRALRRPRTREAGKLGRRDRA